MERTRFYELLDACPVIAAAKNEESLRHSLDADCRVVFVLYGNVASIPEIVARIDEAGKTPVVHIDLVDGLAAREPAVDYIRLRTAAAGIISTKGMLLKRAREVGLIAIQRFFLLDSMALTNIEKQVKANQPDLIEVIPGAMPKVIRGLAQGLALPVIAGGLIRDREDAENALHAGAKAISCSSAEFLSHFSSHS